MFLVNEKVFWFEISVDDGERVEVVEGGDDLGGVEKGGRVRELARTEEL